MQSCLENYPGIPGSDSGLLPRPDDDFSAEEDSGEGDTPESHRRRGLIALFIKPHDAERTCANPRSSDCCRCSHFRSDSVRNEFFNLRTTSILVDLTDGRPSDDGVSRFWQRGRLAS